MLLDLGINISPAIGQYAGIVCSLLIKYGCMLPYMVSICAIAISISPAIGQYPAIVCSLLTKYGCTYRALQVAVIL